MKRLFYGWKMVGAATGVQFLQAGLMTQAFGGYVTGDYRLGFTLLALLVGLGSVFFLAAKKPIRPTSASPAA